MSAATFSSSVCFGSSKECRWISLAPVVVHSASVTSRRTDVTYLKKSNDGLCFSSHLCYPFIVTQMWLKEQCSGVSAGRRLFRGGWASTWLCKHTPWYVMEDFKFIPGPNVDSEKGIFCLSPTRLPVTSLLSISVKTQLLNLEWSEGFSIFSESKRDGLHCSCLIASFCC